MRELVATLLLASSASLLTACDTTVDRFAEGDTEFVFNLAGFLRTEADTQFVRVQRIRESVTRAPGVVLEAHVSLTDLTAGVKVTMTDSLVRLDSGDTGHLFFAVMPIAPGHTYELRAEDEFGRMTSASTTVPERPAFSIAPATTTGSLTTQAVSWLGITRTPDQAVLVYKIARDSSQPPTHAEVPYTLRGRLVQNGWSAEIRLSDDLQILRQEVGIPPDATDAVFSGMAMTIRIPSVEWREGLDGENIVAGTGFFGSVGNFTEDWLLGGEIVETLGFVNGQQP